MINYINKLLTLITNRISNIETSIDSLEDSISELNSNLTDLEIIETISFTISSLSAGASTLIQSDTSFYKTGYKFAIATFSCSSGYNWLQLIYTVVSYGNNVCLNVYNPTSSTISDITAYVRVYRFKAL